MNINQLKFSGDDFAQYKHILKRCGNTNKVVRIELLSSSLKITKELTPKLFAIVSKIENKLKIDTKIEYYACNDNSINASCFIIDDSLIVILTSGLVNIMDDDELSFVIGHEIGHYLFGHLQYSNDDNHQELVEYNQAKEISADRVGFICSKDINTSIKAIIKTISGLNGNFISSNFRTFLHQHNKISDKEVNLLNLSHPLLPTRAKSLMLFSMSELYYNWIEDHRKAPISSANLDIYIQNYLDKTSLLLVKENNLQIIVIFKMWLLAKIFMELDDIGDKEVAILNNAIGREKTIRLMKYIASNNIEKINKKYQNSFVEFVKLSKKYKNEFIKDINNIFLKNTKDYNYKVILKLIIKNI